MHHVGVLFGCVLVLLLQIVSRASAQPTSEPGTRLERVDQFGTLRVRTTLTADLSGGLNAATELLNKSQAESRCAMVALWFFDALGRDVERRRSERLCVGPSTEVPKSFQWRVPLWPQGQREAVSNANGHSGAPR